jgi:PAS domain S-box-containing protein
MLGPLEDALADSAAIPHAQQLRLETAHRNARRLLKLVNTLLEFSRLEAGRAQVSFMPTDLSGLTADLASNFRSACERAALDLVIDCASLREPVYVDRDMWEMIVLNLVSNAFKFTFDGRIEVALRDERDSAVLEVRDTGVGVPADHLPRLFERFNRVEGTRGRTFEGSGIGLALVRELVALHGGRIEAASAVGRGTTFTVTVPHGKAHLPAELVQDDAAAAVPPERAAAFVEEALGWLPEAQARRGRASANADAAPRTTSPRVLLADDNADMRDYVARLLEAAGYDVHAVGDGDAALAAVRERPPEIVLTDVMMPKLDGFGLLRALRSDVGTRGLPVVLLSARAGEVSRIEGFEAGADDYVVKPFSARELLSRVEAQLNLAAIRRESETRFRNFADTAPAMLWITDTAHACTYLSRSWYEFTGLAEGNGLGSGWVDPVHPDDRAAALRTFRDAGTRREAFAIDCRLRAADGQYRWVMNTGRPIFGVNGAFEGYVGLVVEMHERRLMEDALREADQRKDEFIAMLGHELRNPLAAIRNATTLLDYIEHPQLGKIRAVLDRQSTQMIKLVDGLLDVSRIARGKIDLKIETLDLRDLLDGVIRDRRDEADRLELRIASRYPPRPVWIAGDRARLTQIFDNVVGNAVKFSNRGATIDIGLDESGDEAAVRVHDTGVGITPELLEAIFEPFRQDPHDPARAASGIGLGLAQCQ